MTVVVEGTRDMLGDFPGRGLVVWCLQDKADKFHSRDSRDPGTTQREAERDVNFLRSASSSPYAFHVHSQDHLGTPPATKHSLHSRSHSALFFYPGKSSWQGREVS